MTSTTARREPIGLDGDVTAVISRRRVLYAVTTAALALVMGIAYADGLDLVDILGVDSTTSTGTGGGYEIEVEYGNVSRSGLATPFAIEVTRPGGFDGPVQVGVTSEYFDIWDENGFSPTPSSETTAGPWTVWEFDPPIGDTLSISLDARIEPAVQTGKSGQVAVFVDDQPVAVASMSTRVMP